VGFLDKLLRAKPTHKVAPLEQAVLVYLNGSELSDEIYQHYDTSTLEDQLIAVIQSHNLGEFDGNEFGPAGVTLYMYGRDAEVLFNGIEPVLRAYPLCQRARVVIRQGGPGAFQREVRL
jgi:hypothetical protein